MTKSLVIQNNGDFLTCVKKKKSLVILNNGDFLTCAKKTKILVILNYGNFQMCWKEIKQVIRGSRKITLTIPLYNDKMFMKHSTMKKIIISHNHG
jgi:hypothetical protein